MVSDDDFRDDTGLFVCTDFSKSFTTCLVEKDERNSTRRESAMSGLWLGSGDSKESNA